MITPAQKGMLIDLMMEAAGRSPDAFAERFDAVAVAGTPRFSAILADCNQQRAAALQSAADRSIEGRFYLTLLAEMDHLIPGQSNLRARIPPEIDRALAEAEHHAVFDAAGMFDIAWSDAVAKVGPSIGVIRLNTLENPYVGTAILVGSSLLLTAAHVLKTLIDFTTKPPSARVARAPKAQVEFHHPRVVDSDLRPVISKFADNWLEACSPPCGTPPQLNATDDALAHTNLDFALVKLATPVVDIQPMSINAPPAANDNHLVAVAGHLGGTSLKFHLGKLIKINKPTKRLHHLANTSYGLSGGPCVDIDGMIIGIHEGATATYNRSVYLRDIRQMIAVLNPDLVLEQPAEYIAWLPRNLSTNLLSEIGISEDEADRHPVVGRRPFQDWMRAASAARDPRRLALVSGPEASGKSLTSAIMNLHADQRGDLFLSLPPEVARRTDIATMIGAMVARAAGRGTAVDAAGFRPRAGKLRHEIIPDGLDDIERLLKRSSERVSPLFWLSIDFGSDQGWLSGDQDAWKSFFTEALKRTWLRLAIVGISEGRQAEFRTLFSPSAEIYSEVLAPLGWAEIEQFASVLLGTRMAGAQKSAALAKVRASWERKIGGLGSRDRMKATVEILLLLLLKTTMES